jgi:glycosyltransferase involved in cell wall biosynthesis
LTIVPERVRARVRRARFAATPLHARPTQVRRALGRTGLGRGMKAVRRLVLRKRPQSPVEAPARRQVLTGGRNVLFISHCDFTGNSAYHVYSIATELERRGWCPAIAVPGSPRGVRDFGRPGFAVLSFRDVRRGHLRFPNGSEPDLVHAFTPREPVRRLTVDLVRRYGCPYVVHLEDNEMAVRHSVVSAYDPAAVSVFLQEASGVTAVIDRLLELKPDHVPGVVVWPGYDEAIDRLSRPRDAIRRDVGLELDDLFVVYPGNVHEANAEDVHSLYDAIQSLRARGRKVVLVKSGWNSIPSSRLPKLGQGIRDLGWIKRSRVLELLRAADVLVQPGVPGAFNDYRFPAKLPDFLASCTPVILPASNIGLQLDADSAVILSRGDPQEVRTAILRLVDDPAAASCIGSAGRAFALERLTWSRAVTAVESVYCGLEVPG